MVAQPYNVVAQTTAAGLQQMARALHYSQLGASLLPNRSVRSARQSLVTCPRTAPIRHKRHAGTRASLVDCVKNFRHQDAEALRALVQQGSHENQTLPPHSRPRPTHRRPASACNPE